MTKHIISWDDATNTVSPAAVASLDLRYGTVLVIDGGTPSSSSTDTINGGAAAG